MEYSFVKMEYGLVRMEDGRVACRAVTLKVTLILFGVQHMWGGGGGRRVGGKVLLA